MAPFQVQPPEVVPSERDHADLQDESGKDLHTVLLVLDAITTTRGCRITSWFAVSSENPW